MKHITKIKTIRLQWEGRCSTRILGNGNKSFIVKRKPYPGIAAWSVTTRLSVGHGNSIPNTGSKCGKVCIKNEGGRLSSSAPSGGC